MRCWASSWCRRSRADVICGSLISLPALRSPYVSLCPGLALPAVPGAGRWRRCRTRSNRPQRSRRAARGSVSMLRGWCPMRTLHADITRLTSRRNVFEFGASAFLTGKSFRESIGSIEGTNECKPPPDGHSPPSAAEGEAQEASRAHRGGSGNRACSARGESAAHLFTVSQAARESTTAAGHVTTPPRAIRPSVVRRSQSGHRALTAPRTLGSSEPWFGRALSD